jgi:hypothetical protein
MREGASMIDIAEDVLTGLCLVVASIALPIALWLLV